MKYKDKELTEFKPPENITFDPPKKMLVWDSDSDSGWVETNVVAVLPNRSFPVIASSMTWRHCAEIPEEAPKLATNRELAKWLAEGNGQVDTCPSQTGNNIGTFYSYEKGADDAYADGILVRKWGDNNWHEPTIEYMGLEG